MKIHDSNINLVFNSAEHNFLGDSITIKDEDGNTHKAAQKPLVLPNTLKLTYGQINALAGDFYGTWDAISDGKSLEERCSRFRKAWHSLAVDEDRQPEEAENFLQILAGEFKDFENALETHAPLLSPGFIGEMTVNSKFWWNTVSRHGDNPSYKRLMSINWDHFGHDAVTAYETGHYVALQEATKKGRLERAYAMNAFADHFLQDLFAAGHIRTPRRGLHGDYDTFWDYCVKVSQAIVIHLKSNQHHVSQC